MTRAPHRLLAIAATVAALVACGDGSDGGPGFTVDIVRPAADEALYTGQPVAFEVELTPAGSLDVDAETFEFDWTFGDGAATIGGGPAVQHVYAQQGQRSVSVTARLVRGERTVSEAVANLSIAINPAADLTIDQATLTLSQAVIRSGDTFRLSGNLLNQSARVPAPFDVGFYLGDANVFAAIDTLDVQRLGDLLAAGSAIELARTTFDEFGEQPAQAIVDNATLTVPDSAASGEYVAFIFADPDGVVGEDDESNNAAFASRRLPFENSSGDGPDLVTSGVSVRPALANVLTNVTLSANIANAGNAFSGAFDYAVYLSAGNPTLQDEDRLLLTGSVSNLPAGQTFRIADVAVTIDPPVTELGEYFVLVRADSADAVDETNEANNVSASPRVTVTDIEVPGADIVPTSFVVLPSTTFIGGSVQIDLTVANQGDDPVDRQFNCKFYFSTDNVFDANVDTLVQTMLLQPLPAGEEVSQTMDAFVPPIAPGTYTPIVACDPTLLIPESDDANNVLAASSPIVIAAEANVDLRIGTFTVSPTEPANGDPVTVSVDVCNDGSNGSTPSVVRVFISPDSELDTTDTVLLESRVPPIDPGACITVRADVPAACDTFVSEYTVFAAADVTQLVAEANETNNVARLASRLTITGLICACELDRFEPNDAPATAAFLNPSVGRYENLTMCNSNVDYYLVPLLRDETVRVAIAFDHDRGDLDMQLFALDRSTILDESASLGDREEVSYLRIPQRGNYLLRVQGKTPGARNVYDLDIEVSRPSEGTDLIVLDVSTDQERPVLGATVEVCFDLVNLGTTPAVPTLARVYLSNDAVLDPLTDLRLGELEIDGFDARVYRCVDVVLPESSGGGPRYIAVVADARDQIPGELSETNNVGFSPVFFVDDACFDVLEPNNAIDQPRRLQLVTTPPVSFTGLTVCSDNRDFYEICTSDGDFLSVTATFDPAAGDVDMKLWDAGREVARSEGVGSSETVSVDFVTGDRCYIVELYVAGRNREVPYTLGVDTGRAPDELACSRIEEPGDAFGTARLLRDFLDDTMAICPADDEDYYYVQLTPGTTVRFSLRGGDGGAPPESLRMTLFGPSRNFLTNTVTATEVMQYSVALSGRHYLRVRSAGTGPRNMPYQIHVEGLSGTDLVPSNFALERATASPGDTLRFSFTLANTRDVASPEARYALYLSTDPVRSTDDRLLREVDLAPLAGLTERLEGRRFDVPADLVAGGEFFVILVVDNTGVVAEFNENNNIALANLSVAARCLPDAAEPNNFSVDAATLLDFVGVTLSSCGAADVDWFVHTATAASTTYRITFRDADGDLDLFVYREVAGRLELAGFSDSITDDEVVTLATTPGTRYLVQVEQHTDLSTSYSIRVD